MRRVAATVRLVDELYDPDRPGMHDDPYETYRLLRDEHPCYHNQRRDFWTLTRFDDVLSAARDPETFSSAQGISIEAGFSAKPEMLINLDPPRHDELRALVSRAFTPRRIAELEPRIRELTDSLLAQVDPAEPWDLVASLAGPLPAFVIAELCGVPADDHVAFQHWSDTMIRHDPTDPDAARRAQTAGRELYSYIADLVAERRRHPSDDLISGLLAAELDGEHLDPLHVQGFCGLLLVAGHETTTNLIGNTVVALAAHPYQAQRAHADTTLIPKAVEEVLRYDGPVQGLARTTTRDVTLHGSTIPEGSKVMLMFAAANRDERAFPEPDTFDIDRNAGRHLAFGFGVHHCLGAALARLETRIALEALLAQLPSQNLTHEPVGWIPHGPVRGPERLQMRPS